MNRRTSKRSAHSEQCFSRWPLRRGRWRSAAAHSCSILAKSWSWLWPREATSWRYCCQTEDGSGRRWVPSSRPVSRLRTSKTKYMLISNHILKSCKAVSFIYDNFLSLDDYVFGDSFFRDGNMYIRFKNIIVSISFSKN